MIGVVERLPNGVQVFQVTEETAPCHNIYCEFPWCPDDSSCFVYARYRAGDALNRWDYVACEFGTWAKRELGCGAECSMASGRFYYRHYREAGHSELRRVDLSTGKQTPLALPPEVPQVGAKLSGDERYLAWSYPVSWRPQRFAIALCDLHSGQTQVLHEDPYTCNTHLQFHRGNGRQLLVQHNRGCRFSPEGKRELLVGPEGCTLFILSVPDGKVTPLPVGPPHTPSCSGHETWLGSSDDVLLTTNRQEDYDHGNGPILIVSSDGRCRQVGAPWEMNHIGTPDHGRLYCADTYRPDAIIVGSPHTGKVAEVCAARVAYTRNMPDHHPHAYLSPDLRWVIFNSDRSGSLQLYCAALPTAMVAELESPAKS
jgi:hypothetical protein